MIQVKVLKLAGETGLRKPGVIYSEIDTTAAYLAGKGFVELVITATSERVNVKEDKTVIETKEKKFHRTTKKHK